MKYDKLFEPRRLTPTTRGVGDRGDGSQYVFDDEIELAVNVALATRRPLLVRGATGCGKSSLAYSVARQMNARYLETVVSSRTEAEHLLWHVDHLRRLRDAQANRLEEMRDYVQPGILWWALDPVSAEEQWRRSGGPRYERRNTTAPADAQEKTRSKRSDAPAPAVVLLDEIDKADPDLPNNLLVPLGSLTFQVEPLGTTVSADERAAPLLFITSNDERDLPAAFLRRCVELKIEPQDDETLLKIGASHFPELSDDFRQKALDVIVRARPADWRGRPLPVPAEYLDALRAATKLGSLRHAEAVLDRIARMVIWKPSQNVPS